MKTKQTQKKTSMKKTTQKRAALHTRVKGHAKQVLVPHKQNDFRPHLIRVHGLVAVLIIALIAQVVYSAVSTGHLGVLGRISNVEVTELLADTNEQRVSGGLSELTINPQLSDAAYQKAQNMFAEQYWAHVSPSGIEPWKWFGDAGYTYSYAGENLAKNYPTADATVEAWMNSPTHRENIMKSEYVDVGFAVVDGTLEGRETTLVVALYGAPAVIATAQNENVQPTPNTFAAPGVASAQVTPLANFGSALSSLSPVTIGILGLLAIVAIVGVTAHHYRAQLPKSWKKSWRMHHGLYTFVGMIALGVLIIIATGGGSI